MKKLLVICGPTATGKTSVAVYLAKKFNGELVSADSRQVYRKMDIGTGKDLPESSKIQIKDSCLGNMGIGYYAVDGVRLWGYDLVDPKDNFSISQYLNIAKDIFRDIWKRDKLPILVGGTGFYIKGIIDGIETSQIPKDESLRKSLEKKGVEELFEILTQIDSVKSSKLNKSDRNNPRRLVRAIEIALSGKKSEELVSEGYKDTKDILFLGLVAPRSELFGRIKRRVLERVRDGIESEIMDLLKSGLTWNSQSMQSLGYRQWKNYFCGIEKKKDVFDKWIKDEQKYSKRQMTWFKKDGRIKWFDISERDYLKNIEKLVDRWYSKS